MVKHPQTATSLSEECMEALLRPPGVHTSVLDMCRYGMTAQDAEGEAPVRKSTRLATNSPEVADAMSARCCGGHRHVQLVSGRLAAAAVCPPTCCSEFLKSFEMHMRLQDQDRQRGFIREVARRDLCDPSEVEIDIEVGRYVDDVKGGELDPKLGEGGQGRGAAHSP